MIHHMFMPPWVGNKTRNVDPILLIVLLPVVSPSQDFCTQLTIARRLDLLLDDLHEILPTSHP